MNLKKEIDEYLKTQRLMSVATYGEYPWIANVYYVHDSDLNLYFLSKHWREHCKAIELNSKVAVAIADSSQPIYKPQIGLQISGTAAQVNIISSLKWMFKMWNKLIAGENLGCRSLESLQNYSKKNQILQHLPLAKGTIQDFGVLNSSKFFTTSSA